jgi:hypothetical protein
MKTRTRSTIRLLCAVLVAVLLLALMLAPTLAFARAGGGHVSSGGSSSSHSSGSSGGSSSFGGSNSFGSSSSSGSSGSGSFGGFIGPCVCGAPVLIIVVVLVLVLMAANKRKQGGTPAGGPATSAPIVPGAMPAGDPFSDIKAGDPNFNTEMFYGRVNEMFIAIQYAWMNRNLEPVRRFLSDQQFSVLNNSVQTDYVAKSQINKLDNIHVDHMEPVEVVKQGDYDSVKMLITATVIDYTVDERTGALVNPGELGDGKTPTTFQEYWTFMRKSGVQSKMDATITKCPNCGAPVTDGNYVKCAYCGVQMNDPTLDWVLMRIEQV